MKTQLAAFFRGLPLTVYAVAGVLAVAGGWLALNNRHQREIGRREIELSSLTSALRAAKMESDSLAKVQKPQTAAAVKWKTRWDSTGLRQLQTTLDSLKALGVAKPETVTVAVPVAVLATADTAIKACTQALQTCEQRVGAERRGRVAAEDAIKLLKASYPSPVQKWRYGAVGAGIGALIVLVGKP